MRTYHGIIFDLDGTLADTQKDLADSMNRVLKKYGYPGHSLEQYKYLVGKGLKNLVISALPEPERTDEQIRTCLSGVLADYEANCLNKTTLYPGIDDMLTELDKSGLPVSVFTNKEHALALIVCKQLLAGHSIHSILGMGNERPGKPDPSGALFLADKMSLKPENILFAGDTDNDMLCARRANMQAVGVLWGFRDAAELRNNGADYLIDKPSDLLEIIYGNDADYRV